jgi:VWFA-related protein
MAVTSPSMNASYNEYLPMPNPFRSGVWLFLILLAFSPAASSAQETDTQRYSEEIEVRVIDVDVVVTDRHGNPIHGLTREDFELYEARKEVPITYFSSISGGRIQLEPEVSIQLEEGGEPVTVGSVRTPLTWIVYLDQSGMLPGRRNEALRQLRAFLDGAVDEGDRGAIFSFDGLAFRVRQTLTTDKKILLDTVAKVQKDRVHRGIAAVMGSRLRQEIRQADPEDDKKGEFLAIEIATYVQEEAARASSAMRAMGTMLDVLAPVEGRVVLVYVGAGFTTLPGLTLTESWRTHFIGSNRSTEAAQHLASWLGAPQPEVHQPMLEQDMRSLLTKISEGRITVYTIEAGQAGGPSVEDPGTTVTDMPIQGDRAMTNEHATVREMAQRTGGRYFRLNPGLGRQLQAVRQDLNDYYSLGYIPTGPPGRSRDVRVKVKVEGARVRHRETVRERNGPDRAGVAVVAALARPIAGGSRGAVRQSQAVEIPLAAQSIQPELESAANPLGIAIQPEAPQKDGWTRDHLLPFHLNMNLEQVTLQPVATGYRADLLIHFSIAAPDGTVYPIETREQVLSVTRNEVQGADGNSEYSFVWHVDMPPLKIPSTVPIRAEGLRLNVSVEDRATQVRSTTTVPLQRRRGL